MPGSPLPAVESCGPALLPNSDSVAGGHAYPVVLLVPYPCPPPPRDITKWPCRWLCLTLKLAPCSTALVGWLYSPYCSAILRASASQASAHRHLTVASRQLCPVLGASITVHSQEEPWELGWEDVRAGAPRLSLPSSLAHAMPDLNRTVFQAGLCV